MNSNSMVTTLGWFCYAAGGAAVIVYLINVAGRQGWRRPWNAFGLLFTAMALSQLPSLFRNADDVSELRAAFIATICLIGATGLQAVSALRRRKPRSDETPPAAGSSAAIAPEIEAQ